MIDPPPPPLHQYIGRTNEGTKEYQGQEKGAENEKKTRVLVKSRANHFRPGLDWRWVNRLYRWRRVSCVVLCVQCCSCFFVSSISGPFKAQVPSTLLSSAKKALADKIFMKKKPSLSGKKASKRLKKGQAGRTNSSLFAFLWFFMNPTLLYLSI
jgi:hypothetical protein